MRTSISLVCAGLSILMAASSFAGCNKAPTSVEKVTVALVLPHAALVQIAHAKNYFMEEGLDVNIGQFTNGKATLAELWGGTADFATVGEIPLMFAAMKGEDFRVIGQVCSSDKDLVIVAAKTRGITGPGDLKGKRVGVTSGTAGDYFLDIYLSVHGVAKNDVTTVNLKPEEMADALTSGRVDAISSWNPTIIRLQKTLGDKGISFYGETIHTGTHSIATKRDFLDRHPETVSKLLRALVKAERYAGANKDDSVAITAAAAGLDKVLLNELWGINTFKVTLEQSLLMSLENGARWAIRNKLTDKTAAPNYLDYISLEGLHSVKPEAVTILH